MKLSHNLKTDGNIFFTSDQHYFHANILKYTKRPYKNLDEMHEALISKHNEIVTNKDTVIHLGDFSFRSPHDDKLKDIFKQLNGKHHHLCYGNHDHNKTGDMFDTWSDYLELNVFDGINRQMIVGCHFPFQVWNKSHHGAWHIHGHSHGSLAPYGKRQDVGVDCNDCYPFSYQQLKKILDARQVESCDHHE